MQSSKITKRKTFKNKIRKKKFGLVNGASKQSKGAKIKKRGKEKNVAQHTKNREESLKDMEFEEFMEEEFDGEEDSFSSEDATLEEEKEENDQEEAEGPSEATKFKSDLADLKETDPEFYEFLSKEDKDILDFDIGSQSEDEDDKQEYDGKTRQVTTTLINKWRQLLKTKECRQVLPEVVAAFHAAVVQAEGSEEDNNPKYICKGNDVFNMVVKFCLVEIIPASFKFLKALQSEKNFKPSRYKRWRKLRTLLKLYIADMVKLLSMMSDSSLKLVLLKHVHQLMPFVCAIPRQAKLLTKQLVVLWGSGEPSVQVLAFMCILRITREHHKTMLDPVLKGMYMTYVKSVKFTSARNWPSINMMRRSLVEMYGLDHAVAYKHVFLYVRQLAIHLRNAITSTAKKKDYVSTVYNWQFIHSLHLWSQLLGTVHPSDNLQPLIYPLTQVIIGTIGLVSVARYYPLRFLCCRMLTELSQQTRTFIPVLPFLLEVLNSTDFNKKHSKSSVRPMDFTCMLKLSLAQMCESGFRDGLIEQVYDVMLIYLSSQCHRIGFPELVLPAVIQLKTFLKSCKVANFTRKMKQLLTKIEENSCWIEERRKCANCGIADFDKIQQWENTTLLENPPLLKYYEQWKAVAQKKKELITQNEEEEIDFPKVSQLKKTKKQKLKERKEESEEEVSEEEEDSERKNYTNKEEESRSEDSDDNINEQDQIDTLNISDFSDSD